MSRNYTPYSEKKLVCLACPQAASHSFVSHISERNLVNELVETEEESTWSRTKRHFRDNKKVYIAGGIGLAIGAAAAALLGKKSGPALQVASINHSPGATIRQHLEVHIEALGDPGNIIQDLDTGTIYASQNQAAEALGVSRSRISSHVNGHIPDADGHRLAKLGKAHVSA
jgi:hypothetical protein